MEQINLNIIPSGVAPVCHASQYDEGRTIRANLFDGSTAYKIVSGDTVTLNVRKPDDTIVTAAVTVTIGNTYVEFDTTEQMTAVFGSNLCDLTIENGGVKVGTLNFIMEVETDVLSNGDPSQSEIHDLEAQVEDIIESSVWGFVEVEGTLTAGQTVLTISDAAIVADATYDIFTEVWGVGPETVVVTTGTIVLTFEAQGSDLDVKVRIFPNE